MVLRLMITEHVDPLHMKYVGMEQCIHEVLFTLAANQGQAYAYAKSSAGALGLSQFVESSYQIVRENYPKAHLEPDFALGMVNLNNAVMASVLLLDLELTDVPKTTLKRSSIRASNSRRSWRPAIIAIPCMCWIHTAARILSPAAMRRWKTRCMSASRTGSAASSKRNMGWYNGYGAGGRFSPVRTR